MRRRELLASAKSADGRGTYNNYEYVDLQLTGDAKNLMFATCNVGATAETVYGNYYSWGAGSTTYQISNQYHTGGTDVNYFLPLSADTARQVMGGLWRTPTYKELMAFTAQTTYEWTTINGVNGGKFSKTIDGKKRYVFFPAAGYYSSGSLGNEGSYGCVWSSTPYDSSNAHGLYFVSGYKGISYYNRNYGQSVRGVFRFDGRGKNGENEFVELNLPSKLRWCNYNVGATSETGYGYYYQYGKGSSQYQSTSGQTSYTSTINPLPLSADTASKKMGGGWRMPTSAQCQELINNTNYSWTTINGVKGAKFTSKTNSKAYVFFPASGWYPNTTTLTGKTTAGIIWTSTPKSSSTSFDMGFISGSTAVNNDGNRKYGCSVRGIWY